MDPFIGEIRLFGFNQAPMNWATCDGQVMMPYQNSALFSLIGNIYGGDGRNTFNLPDLRGRVPININYNSGDTPYYNVGDSGGLESVALTANNVPMHNHTLYASAEPGNSNVISGTNSFFATATSPIYSSSTSPSVELSPQTCSSIGNGNAHDNMQPYLVINFCIAICGIYPSRP